MNNDITIAVKPEINKYQNYFYKLANEASDFDLTNFLEDKGVDIAEYNILFFPMNNYEKLLYVQANDYDEEKRKYCKYKAYIQTIPS